MSIKEDIKEFIASDNKDIGLPYANPSPPRNKLLVFFRCLLFQILRKVPPSKFKNSFYRLAGVNLGKDVCLPMDVLFDWWFPELTIIEDGTLIGGYTHFWNHDLKDGKLTLAKVRIGGSNLVGGDSPVHGPVEMGDHNLIGLRTTLTGLKIGDNGFWGGGDSPRKIKDLETGWDEVHYEKGYYKRSRKQIKEFIKQWKGNSPPKERLLIIRYNGKRLNAGDDWHKVRSVFRIYWTSAIIEFCGLLPGWRWKNLLLRLTGAKIALSARFHRKSYIDHIYPELVTVGKNAIIKKLSYIGTHSFTVERVFCGKTDIGDNSVLEESSLIHAGAKVGRNCSILGDTFVNKEIPDGETWGGIPAKKVS